MPIVPSDGFFKLIGIEINDRHLKTFNKKRNLMRGVSSVSIGVFTVRVKVEKWKGVTMSFVQE